MYRYLKYVLRHKWYVFVAGLSLRVWWYQLILHDWTKFLPIEWFGYARYYYGYRSLGVVIDFDHAWNHHQKHNKHHWQYWVMEKDDEVLCLRMPERFIREMVADWIGAGRAISGRNDVIQWYQLNRHKILLNPITRRRVHELLGLDDSNFGATPEYNSKSERVDRWPNDPRCESGNA